MQHAKQNEPRLLLFHGIRHGPEARVTVELLAVKERFSTDDPSRSDELKSRGRRPAAFNHVFLITEAPERLTLCS
jgi:hypothetical protein